MQSNPIRTLVLAFIMMVLILPAAAWSQLRVKSGASKSSIEHPKALESRVFNLTNEARRKNGLAPLTRDERLAAQAREKGNSLIKNKSAAQSADKEKKVTAYDKEEPAKIGLGGKPGENIHLGIKDDYSDVEIAARLIVNGFMGAAALRDNILNPAFTHLGVGVAIKGKESYVIQEFGPRDGRSSEVAPKQAEK